MKDDANKSKLNEQFLKEAEDSLKHYQETGLHLTLEEVLAWLRSEFKEIPKSHT